MVSGNIAITTTPAYCTYADWFGKTHISTTDESTDQFVIDLREAHFLVRRKCYHLIRERIIYKRSDNKAYLPIKWLADGNMDGTVDKNDILIYQLSSDGLSFDEVALSNVDSIDAFNNYILFDSSFSPTRQLYITYYCCSKNHDEISVDELKRVVMAQCTILVIDRLRLGWGLKGNTGWTVPGGISVTKDISSYEKLYNDAKRELDGLVSFLKPFVGRRCRTGMGRGRSS